MIVKKTLSIDSIFIFWALPILVLLPYSTSVDFGVVFNYGVLFGLITLPIVVVLVVSAGSSILYKKQQLLGMAICLLVALTFFWLLIILVLSSNLHSSIIRTFYPMLGAVFISFFCFCTNKARVLTVLRHGVLLYTLSLSLYFMSVFLVSVLENGIVTTVTQRFVGGAMSLPWGASNIISLAILAGILLLGMYESYGLGKVKSVAIMFASISILLTLSRTGFVMVFFFIIVLILGRLSAKNKLRALLLLIVFLPPLVILLFDYISALDFFSNRYSVQNFSSLNGRSFIWKSYIDIFQNNIAMANGFYGSLNDNKYSPHNLIFAFYYDGGLPLVLLFLITVFLLSLLLLRNSLQLMRVGSGRGASISVILPLILFTNLMFEDGIYTPQIWVLMSLFVCLILHGPRFCDDKKNIQAY